MEIDYTPLQERLDREKEKYLEKVELQKSFQKKIDLLINNKWLNSLPDAKVSCHINTWFMYSLELSISEVPIEEFIDNILSKFHKEFGYFWKLELTGDENDPTFYFEDRDRMFSDIKFQVKEGKFTSCRFEKKVIRFTKPTEAQPVHILKMICE